MTVLGFILIGIVFGRLIGPAYWWVNILQLILALGFIIAGQLRVIRRVERARAVLNSYMVLTGPSQEELDEWNKRGRERREDKDR